MMVMRSERLSPDAASRLAFHREPAPVARNILQDFVSTAPQGREYVRKAKRLAAYLNALRPLRPHILQRYLHRGNRYLLARSMSPDPNPAELRPSCFVARSNIPSSAHLLRGRSRSLGRRLASASPTLMRICRGPSPTREPRPIFRQTL